MFSSKCKLLITLILFIFGCQTSDKYIVGTSFCEKLTVEEVAEHYLNAICEGNELFLSCIVEPDPLMENDLTVPADPNNKACSLRMLGVSPMVGQLLPFKTIVYPEKYKDIEPYPIYLIELVDDVTNEGYYFQFYVKNGRIYLFESLTLWE